MEYLHYEFDIGPDDVVEVELDSAANVQLLDDFDFMNYENREAFNYYGGYVTDSPYRISPPHQGHWHLVIDLGGDAGFVSARVRVLSAHAA